MIQLYTWELDLDGHDMAGVQEYLQSMGKGIMAHSAFLRDVHIVPFNDTFLRVTMRVFGKDRWACQGHARQLAEKMLQEGMLRSVPAVHTETVTEPNRWQLKDGEGRTPRPRPPRTTPLPQ